MEGTNSMDGWMDGWIMDGYGPRKNKGQLRRLGSITRTAK